MMKLCIINIGNTSTRIYADGKEYTVPTETLTADMIPAGPCAASSVVPEKTRLLQSARRDIFWITKDTPGMPDLSHVDASTVGADRLANAAKLLFDGVLPAVTIDCGTAVNCEIVAPDGAFLGGAIYPGRKLLRKALNLFTAQLPEIPEKETLPDVFPGRNTQGCLEWGTDGMALAAISDFIERTRLLFPDAPLRIVFCGGDGDFFYQYFKDRPGTESGGAEFTRDGIRALYERNNYDPGEDLRNSE